MTNGAPIIVVIIFIGNETFFNTEFAKASANNSVMLPINKQVTMWSCWLALLNSMRDNIGTEMPTKAMGPQKAVVTPVKTEEISIK